MGMFSWECIACKKAFLNNYGSDEKTKWASDVILFAFHTEMDRNEWTEKFTGEYDGYGCIIGFSLLEYDDDGEYNSFRAFHKVCWDLMDIEPTVGNMLDLPNNKSAANQGFFLSDRELEEYSIEPTLILH